MLVLILMGTCLAKEQGNLTEEAAAERFNQVSKVHYDLEFVLKEKQEKFHGKVTLNFELKDKIKDLRIDFSGGKIERLLVQGNQIKKINYNGNFLIIPRGKLSYGKNKINISFSHPYSTDGAGLHRFVDPEDKNTYLYTDFEPYDANRLFPCFDQPDLRATYSMEVFAPADWSVITSTGAKKVQKIGLLKRWTFEKSENFSTYIFPLHAGPYHVWEDKAENIPLRLFARKSMAKYIDAPEWFTVTKQGFNFFQKYFGTNYPYKKYDQIIVPDFNAGAMENVAAVTFSERYAYRAAPTYNQRESRASVILHEMAHMWFGNLVTMKWWNGLWLNESFATYMATKALSEATEFTKSFQTFYGRIKQWAYWEDQLVTTHPIEVPVSDTDNAFTNFDGITYGKGASVLKQINYVLGEKAFQRGLKLYFRNYQNSNTTLSDFFGSLSKGAKKNLDPWVREWITTAGLNTVKSEFKCEKGKISSFSLIQSAPEDHPTLRSHRVELALFKNNGKELVRSKVIDVSFAGKETKVPQARGSQCPDFVYPNYNDYGFVKVDLDDESLSTALLHIDKFKEPFVRHMVWFSLWEMVRDGKLRLQQFSDLVLAKSSTETDYKTLDDIVRMVVGKYDSSPSVVYYLNAFPNKKLKQKILTGLEKLFWERLQKAKSGSDFQKLWLDGFIKVAHNRFYLRKLQQILAGDIKLRRLPIDQDRRWEIIVRLNTFAFDDSQKLITQELKRDKSDLGAKMAIAAEVSRPDLQIKQKWFKEIVSENTSYNLSKLKKAMWSLFPNSQRNFRAQFSMDYFNKLEGLLGKRPSHFLSSFSNSLVPTSCNTKNNELLSAYLNKSEALPPIVAKKLKIARQEDDRCQKIISL